MGNKILSFLFTIPYRQLLNALEQSNVDLQKDMSTLIEAQPLFQLNSRALSFANQMDCVINNIMSK